MRALTRLAMPTLVVTLLGGGTSRALDISSCDQSVAANDTGVLQADLTCSAQTGVTLGQGATLQPLIRTVARIHVVEEARHVKYAREELPRQIEGASRAGLAYSRLIIGRAANSIVNRLVHPNLYRAVGLDPKAGRAAAMANPNFRATLRCRRPYQERMSPSHCRSAFRAIGNADSETVIIPTNWTPSVRSVRGRKDGAAFQAPREHSRHLLNSEEIQTGNPASAQW